MEKAIMITIPKWFIHEFYERWMWDRVIMYLEKPDSGQVWHHGLPSVPKNEVIHCYIVFDNLIQFRLNIAGFHNGQRDFFDLSNNITRDGGFGPYVELCGPLVRPDHPIPMGGFQGYRYVDQLF